MKPIKEVLDAHNISAHSPEDTTLSGGEHAQAVIVAALLEYWDGLDGQQQRSLTDVLHESTTLTEDGEAWARKLRKNAVWNEGIQ